MALSEFPHGRGQVYEFGKAFEGAPVPPGFRGHEIHFFVASFVGNFVDPFFDKVPDKVPDKVHDKGSL
jgi:hypothetical protein